MYTMKLYIISVKTTRVYALRGHYVLYIIMCTAIGAQCVCVCVYRSHERLIWIKG